MVNKELLEIRRKAKKKKPNFVVKESHFSARVKSRWRFPRGMHSKVRQMHVGRPALPNRGYGSPRMVRGLHANGLEMIKVSNSPQLLELDSQRQGAVIAKVGSKKKLELLTVAKEKNITVLNIKNIDNSLENLRKSFEERRRLRKEKQIQMSKKEEEKKKKADEKKKNKEAAKKVTTDISAEKAVGKENEAPSSEEEQKKMMEKIITKRQ